MKTKLTFRKFFGSSSGYFLELLMKMSAGVEKNFFRLGDIFCLKSEYFYLILISWS